MVLRQLVTGAGTITAVTLRHSHMESLSKIPFSQHKLILSLPSGSLLCGPEPLGYTSDRFSGF